MTMAAQRHRSGIQINSNPYNSLGGNALQRMVQAPAQPPARRFTASMALSTNQGIVAMNPAMSRQTGSIYGAIQSSQKPNRNQRS
jgi:hypothetical protein